MKILHILRSEPDEMVRRLINELSTEEKNTEIQLYQENVNYEQLVKHIFESDRAICWL